MRSFSCIISSDWLIMNGKAIFQLSFHAFAAVMYFCALVRYEYLPPMPHKREIEHFAGRLKYLTYWNLIVHFLYFAFSCAIDVMKSSSKHSKLTRVRDNLYAGIVVPYGIFVVFMFWGIYSLDRELIFPTALDAFFPSWLNHVSHTVILPVLLIETYIIKHRQPSLLDALKYAAVFGLAYLLWYV
ncbi:hypothetical protein CEXT_744271 [Caerostris extrusa]|uniref:Androgen-dependent TFPI-regulating protein n=1 Tax=Caerostris extrusa TaxID=172846 RepID=A0AAV4P4V2_CAEEX|nr:hypothetical protein CEXT_744271 [Caerostris extrusa]